MDIKETITKWLSEMHVASGALPPDDPHLASLGHVQTVLRAALKKKVLSPEEKIFAEKLAAYNKWKDAAPKVYCGKFVDVDPIYKLRNPPPPLN